MALKKIKAREVYFSLYDLTGSAWFPLACLTSNSISESQDVTESDPNKCEEFTDFSYGQYTYEMSAEGIFLDNVDPNASGKASYDWVHAKMKADRTAKTNSLWKETTKHSDGTLTYRYGEGIVTSLELTAESEGDATFSLSLQGIGEITTVDPTVGGEGGQTAND